MNLKILVEVLAILLVRHFAEILNQQGLIFFILDSLIDFELQLVMVIQFLELMVEIPKALAEEFALQLLVAVLALI